MDAQLEKFGTMLYSAAICSSKKNKIAINAKLTLLIKAVVLCYFFVKGGRFQRMDFIHKYPHVMLHV